MPTVPIFYQWEIPDLQRNFFIVKAQSWFDDLIGKLTSNIFSGEKLDFCFHIKSEQLALMMIPGKVGYWNLKDKCKRIDHTCKIFFWSFSELITKVELETSHQIKVCFKVFKIIMKNSTEPEYSKIRLFIWCEIFEFVFINDLEKWLIKTVKINTIKYKRLATIAFGWENEILFFARQK